MEKLTFLTENLSPVWTPEEVSVLNELLNRRYIAYLGDEKFSIEGNANKSRVQLTVTLAKDDLSFVYPIEALHLKDPSGVLSDKAMAELMLDYIDTYWNEYLSEERDVYLPLDWSKHSSEETDFHLRGFVRHLSLEAEADEFLNRHGHGAYEIKPISSEL